MAGERAPCDFVCAEAGLCNKLRSVLSYRQVALERGRRLLVLWRLGVACEARFDELFEPLAGVAFVHDVAEMAQPQREALVSAGGASAASVFDSHPAIKYTEAESHMYSALEPLPPLRAAVRENLTACGGAFVAVHMRRTDHAAMFGDRTLDDAFFAFLDAHPLPIFLATDNRDTQLAVARRYPGRLRALAPVGPAPAGEAAASEVRHTSVARAVVDLFTCVEAAHFMGTRMSSFSDAIALLRREGGRDVSADDHVVRSLGGKHYDPEIHSVELPGASVQRPRAGSEGAAVAPPAAAGRVLRARRRRGRSGTSSEDVEASQGARRAEAKRARESCWEHDAHSIS